MNLEEAIPYLRQGYAIQRNSSKNDEYLQGTPEKPIGSYYLTLWDVLADDWEIVN